MARFVLADISRLRMVEVCEEADPMVSGIVLPMHTGMVEGY